ncbi:beta strand repeat-containing protein, partial [Flavobacterium sp. Root420]|uniref:beta strand repeat-containing protein n=1 Tax=Flavobacterium sp. Root420 TaxID=1736533 RepID=UPI000AE782F5
MGYQTLASGNYGSIAGGNQSVASGQSAIALGNNTTASGSGAVSMGQITLASGSGSVALGQGTTASSTGEISLGMANAITIGDGFNPIQTDALFQLGNGSSAGTTIFSRNNAVTILKNAHTAIGVNGLEVAAKPTELLDLGGDASAGNGGLKIRNINSPAYTGAVTDNLVVADATGVLKTISSSNFTGATGAQGVAGTNGTNGADGKGIASTADNGNGTFTITYTDGTTFVTSNFTGPQGIAGTNGTNGVAGTNGTNGADGKGIASTTDNGNGTFTITYTDGTTFVTSNLTGPQGVAGTNGTNGVDGATGSQGIQGVSGNGITSTTDNGNGT